MPDGEEAATGMVAMFVSFHGFIRHATLFWIFISAAASSDPELHILEPRNGALYAVKDYSTSSVIIKYEASNLPEVEDSKDIELCIQMYSYPTGSELLQNFCFPRSEWDSPGTKSINNIPLGTFDITMLLKSSERGLNNIISIVNSRFTIKAFEELLPNLFITGTFKAGDKAAADSDIYRYFPDHASALSDQLELQRYMSVASVYNTAGDDQVTDLLVPFEFGTTSLPLDSLQVCADIINMAVDTGPSETLSCFSAMENSLTLYGLRPGTYLLRLVLADSDDRAAAAAVVENTLLDNSSAKKKGAGRRLFEKSGVITVIEVKPFQQIIPSIRFPFRDNMIEAAIEPPKNSADVKFEFEILGVQTAVAQVQPCVKVVSRLLSDNFIANNSRSAPAGSSGGARSEEESSSSDLSPGTMEIETLSFTCVKRDQLSLTLSKLKAGDHTVTLTLRLSEEPRRVFADETAKTFTVFVRDKVEFIPTYDWRPLREWHTIPAGIETRLPLSDAGRKEAKIPEPWRLQVAMPSPCKYFLRTDVTRSTTVHKLIDLAAKQCGSKDTSCFVITGDGEPLSPSETMESSNFFSKRHGLKLDPSCA